MRAPSAYARLRAGYASWGGGALRMFVGPTPIRSPIDWALSEQDDLQARQSPPQRFAPASLTCVFLRSSQLRLVSPFRCTTPASLTRVLLRSSVARLASRSKILEPGVADLRVAEVKCREAGQPLQMFAPQCR